MTDRRGGQDGSSNQRPLRLVNAQLRFPLPERPKFFLEILSTGDGRTSGCGSTRSFKGFSLRKISSTAPSHRVSSTRNKCADARLPIRCAGNPGMALDRRAFLVQVGTGVAGAAASSVAFAQRPVTAA